MAKINSFYNLLFSKEAEKKEKKQQQQYKNNNKNKTPSSSHSISSFKGKKFCCETCGKKFTRKYAYTRHKLAHRGAYTCFCGKKFGSKSHLAGLFLACPQVDTMVSSKRSVDDDDDDDENNNPSKFSFRN